jgi:NADH-quinone oxidoreductase subunit G
VLPREGGRDAQAMLATPARAYLLHGIEPQFDLAQPDRALRALSGAKVVALAAFASDDLREVADVILPIGAFPEIEGTLTNLDGLQQGGAPGARLPGDARSGWRVLKALADQLGLGGFGFTDFAGLRSGLDPHTARSGEGMADVAIGQGDGGNALERIASTPIYRADAVLRRAPALNAHPLTVGPRAVLNPRDAARLGLREGAMLKLGDGAGTGALPLALSPRVAEGAVWVETGYAASAPLARDGVLTVTGA